MLLLESNFFNVALRKTIQVQEYRDVLDKENIGATAERKSPLDEEGFGGESKALERVQILPSFPRTKEEFGQINKVRP